MCHGGLVPCTKANLHGSRNVGNNILFQEIVEQGKRTIHEWDSGRLWAVIGARAGHYCFASKLMSLANHPPLLEDLVTRHSSTSSL
ncbi:hypothetical protein AMATHDRAFT_71795 [Amanita thiersii Skay4041]|uniref:Uncharacterized protein n=1 Tax=Amanita thiersii Skay4041 TaxID=703135 RepID=A0A2A9NAT1_9AGAR|nr:hypothetical protein AMATHDRAFT_71795 [Amanita thiersii Skay4041]